jgi:hypothetical protein
MMEGVFMIIVLWLILCWVCATIGRELIECLGYLLVFLLECLWVALVTILKWTAIGFVYVLRALWRGLFVRRVDTGHANAHRQEQRHDEQHEQRTDEGRSPEYEEANDYLTACLILDLEPGRFTRETFKKAYRRAIMDAHPDRGGDERLAKGYNFARDVIRQKHGWA